MHKKRWLTVLVSVLVLAVAVWTFAYLLPEHTKTSPLVCNPNTSSSSGTVAVTACPKKLLVFSKTGAFRHASIKDAIAALRKLAAQHNVAADFTEDASVFTDENLRQYNAVVFLLTTGHILDDNQQAAFERYIEAGGGYVGVHSASDTEYDWAWYGKLMGAYFDRIHGHSSVTQATIHVIDRTHPSTTMLPTKWVRTDEWYNFATNPHGSVHVLMTLDETTYKGGVMGVDHPIAWYHEFDGGRAWYTALGHTSESYSEPLLLDHLWGGVVYAARYEGSGPDGR